MVLKYLNYLFVPLLLLIMISTLSDTNRADWGDIRFIADIFKRLFPFIALFRVKSNDSVKDKKVLFRVGIGLLVSIPLLFIIILLLSSADMVFRDLFYFNFSQLAKHILVVLVISLYSICFFWALAKAIDGNVVSKYKKINWRRFLDPIVLITILGILNIVYCVFSVIQFRYLFSGVLPSEYTYAEYARRGFFELVVVSLINFIIILIAVWFLKMDENKTLKAARTLLTVLVCFTFIVLTSAFYRMVLYEQAYGFTYLRIFVQAFMVLLFLLFMLNTVFIWYERFPIIKACFIVTIVVYIALNFSNVDAIIARNNIKRYEKTGQIDMAYLKSLSYDSIQEISLLADDESKSEEIMIYFRSVKKDLAELKDWQNTNLSRIKAKEIVSRYTEK